MAKAGIKTCRYNRCIHNTRDIDISKEPYVLVGSRNYYHSDCFMAKKSEDDKEQKIKADMQLIRNIWKANISNTVVYSELNKVLNQLIYGQGIDSEYIVFAVQYCIKHKDRLHLNYPNGLKFFLDKGEIKEAYRKKVVAENWVSPYSFRTKRNEDEVPQFAVSKKVARFDDALGDKK